MPIKISSTYLAYFTDLSENILNVRIERFEQEMLLATLQFQGIVSESYTAGRFMISNIEALPYEQIEFNAYLLTRKTSFKRELLSTLQDIRQAKLAKHYNDRVLIEDWASLFEAFDGIIAESFQQIDESAIKVWTKADASTVLKKATLGHYTFFDRLSPTNMLMLAKKKCSNYLSLVSRDKRLLTGLTDSVRNELRVHMYQICNEIEILYNCCFRQAYRAPDLGAHITTQVYPFIKSLKNWAIDQLNCLLRPSISPKSDLQIFFDLDCTLFIFPVNEEETLLKHYDHLTCVEHSGYRYYMIFLEKTKNLIQKLLGCGISVGFITAADYERTTILRLLEKAYELPTNKLQSSIYLNRHHYGDMMTPKGEKVQRLIKEGYVAAESRIVLVDDNSNHTSSMESIGQSAILATGFFTPTYNFEQGFVTINDTYLSEIEQVAFNFEKVADSLMLQFKGLTATTPTIHGEVKETSPSQLPLTSPAALPGHKTVKRTKPRL